MKELKFRQFVNGRWHYWGNLGNVTSFVGPITPVVTSFMFTGLLDKSGKEIYEGAVVKLNDRFLDQVVFRNGMFTTSQPQATSVLGEWGVIEIIGNTIENPELLKKQCEGA